MRHIFRCDKCKEYTLKETCPKCNIKTLSPKPVKFSPEDKYGKYRRKIKKEELVKEGVL